MNFLEDLCEYEKVRKSLSILIGQMSICYPKNLDEMEEKLIQIYQELEKLPKDDEYWTIVLKSTIFSIVCHKTLTQS